MKARQGTRRSSLRYSKSRVRRAPQHSHGGFAASPISNGELPVLQGSGAIENTSDDLNLTNWRGFYSSTATQVPSMHRDQSRRRTYLGIGGIHFRQYNSRIYNYTAMPNGVSHTWNGSDAPSAMWAFSGQNHILFIGNEVEDTMNGALMKSTPSVNPSGGIPTNGQLFSAFQQFTGNYIHHFSIPGSFGTHGMYLQALHTIVDGNLFDDPQKDCSGLALTACNYDNGDFIKMRGGDSIIRYNIFRGTSSPDTVTPNTRPMSDTWQFMSPDENLGVQGDTNCAHSGWCSGAVWKYHPEPTHHERRGNTERLCLWERPLQFRWYRRLPLHPIRQLRSVQPK